MIVLGLSFFFFGRVVYADVSAGSVSCHTASDCAVNANNPLYDVSFNTNDSAPATVIHVTFPNGYILGLSGALNIYAPDISAFPGVISVNGVDVPGVYADKTGNTLNIHIPSTDLSVGVVAFRVSGTAFTNPSIVGLTGDFTITTNALNETTQTNISGVTMSLSWLDGWNYRKRISIDHTKVGSSSEDETNFPVLISLSGLSHINTN